MNFLRYDNLFDALLIFMLIWKVSSQTTDGDFITTTNSPNEENETSVMEMIYLFNLPLEDKTKLLKLFHDEEIEEYFYTYINSLEDDILKLQTQIENQSDNILPNMNDNINKLKQKDDTIANLNSQIDIKIIEATRASERYEEIIKNKDIELQLLQSILSSFQKAIDKNNAAAPNFDSILQQFIQQSSQQHTICINSVSEQQQENTKLKLQLQQSSNEIKEFQNQINACQVNSTNFEKRSDEKIKKCHSDQNSLVSCRMALISEKDKSYDKNSEMKKLINESEKIHEKLVSCQKHYGEKRIEAQQKTSFEKNLNDCEKKRADIENNLRRKTVKLSKAQPELDNCTSIKDELLTQLNINNNPPSSCLNLSAGIHEIQLTNDKRFNLLCDSDGWMIIQKRFDGSQDFNNNWHEYVNGFGHLREEFFIGMEKLHLITSSTRYQLLISIKHPWGSFSAQYDDFSIGNSTSFYNLVSIGRYNGNLNVFQWNVNQPFSTYDQNHYLNAQNCAEVFKGGWWYQPSCSDDNLNGSLYGSNSTPSGTTLMKIRPYTDLY